MFSHQIAQVVHQDRQHEIEQRMRFRAAVDARSRSRNDSSASIRQSIGHRVIGIGRAIAADGQARTRVGDPCGPIAELAARR